MSSLILLVYALSYATHVTPIPTLSLYERQGQDSVDIGPPVRSEEHPHLDLFFTRTVFTCLMTIFGCLWVSVHPNAPSPRDTAWRKLRRRIEVVLWAFIVPELIVCWAVRQWVGARNLKERYRAFGWSMAHGHFLQMGGWVVVRPWPSPEDSTTVSGPNTMPLSTDPNDPLSSSFLARQVLSSPLLDNLLSYNPKPLFVRSITPPLLFIRAHSTADSFITTLVVLQTLWFFIQAIARTCLSHTNGNDHVRILRIELVTVGYIVMSLMMYILWWDKPMDVRVLREVALDLDRDDCLRKQWNILAKGLATPPAEKAEGEERQGIETPRPISDLTSEGYPVTLSDVELHQSGNRLPLGQFVPHSAVDKHSNPSITGLDNASLADPQGSAPTTQTPTVADNVTLDAQVNLHINNADTVDDLHTKSKSRSPRIKRGTSDDAPFPTTSQMVHSRPILPSDLASSSTSSINTPQYPHLHEIEEIPRTRSPTLPTLMNQASSESLPLHISLPTSARVPPRDLYRLGVGGQRNTLNASCHLSSGERFLAQHFQRTEATARDENPRSNSRASNYSDDAVTAESTFFERFWYLVRSNELMETLNIAWFFRRCLNIMVGPWGKKGYRASSELEAYALGKLWMPPPFLPELIDQHHDKLDKTTTDTLAKTDKLRKRVHDLWDRVPTFYAVTSASASDDRAVKLLAGGLGMLFGAFHLICWNFAWGFPVISGPSPNLPEDLTSQLVFTIIWRVMALVTTLCPIFTAFAMLRLSEASGSDLEIEQSILYLLMEVMVFPLTLLYIPARLLLVTLCVAELVRIGEGWDAAIETGVATFRGEWGEAGALHWIRFIPHIQ